MKSFDVFDTAANEIVAEIYDRRDEGKGVTVEIYDNDEEMLQQHIDRLMCDDDYMDGVKTKGFMFEGKGYAIVEIWK